MLISVTTIVSRETLYGKVKRKLAMQEPVVRNG